MWLLCWLACAVDPAKEGPPAGDTADAAPTVELCDNGDDDDGDGLTDCADVDCEPACPEDCANGVDDDGDRAVDCADPECACDADGDGFLAVAAGGEDCDDTRADVFPGAPELCDGVDDDCDGLVDDFDPDVEPDRTFFRDLDADGYGAARPVAVACAAPPGHVDRAGDCDDSRADVHIDAPEVCDGVDNDCDGLLDDDDPALDLASRPVWYPDVDGDGLGDPDRPEVACEVGPGWVLDGSDCDDGDHANGGPRVWRPDGDGDGFGAGVGSDERCVPPMLDWVDGPEDCDDGAPATFPGAVDVACDRIDQDCDGVDAPCSVESLALATLVGDGVFFGAGAAVVVHDLTGDGVAEVVVGVPNDDGAAPVAGAAVAVSAPVGRVGLGLDALRVDGLERSKAGSALAAGDLDGDGWADLVVGAPDADGVFDSEGMVALIAGPWDRSRSFGSPDASVHGTRIRSLAGSALATGDLAGPALLVGAPGDSDDGTFTGRAALFLGVTGSPTLDDADTRFPGRDILHRMGSAVALPGDLDGDGSGDVVVGARGDATNGFDAGAVGIHRWPVLGDRAWADADARWLGTAELDALGTAVAAGDVDGDGALELVVGAPGADRVYVLAGDRDGVHRVEAAAARVVGAADGRLGTAVAVGDVDGDGHADLWLGAPDHSEDRGLASLYLGPLVGAVDVAAWSVIGTGRSDALGGALAVHGDALWVGAVNGEARLGAAYLLPADGGL
ncbi:MAG: hypothetical protein ACI8PZ_005099 [Myxococcota bacterium]|jgi:hypothetical protein